MHTCPRASLLDSCLFLVTLPYPKPGPLSKQHRKRAPYNMHVPCRCQLLTECAALDGSGTPQCFVHGLSMVQECATAHDPVPPDPLPSLFAAGQVPPSSSLCK